MENNRIPIRRETIIGLCVRGLLSLVFPPLAVIDKGIKAILLVLLFTLFGWFPGTILAFLICLNSGKNTSQW